MLETIYVHVAAAADPDLEATIKSAYSNAASPERVHFGVVNQIFSTDQKITNPYILKNKNVTYVEIEASKLLGLGAARLWAASLARTDYDFALQIDAHMIFERDWDQTLIKNLKVIEEDISSNKVVLTAYPPDWEHGSDGSYSLLADNDVRVELNIDPDNFKLEDVLAYNLSPTDLGNDIAVVYTPENEEILDDIQTLPGGSRGLLNPFSGSLLYLESTSLSGHYVFSRGVVLREFLHDPRFNWGWDQTNYGFRLTANGYKIYTPNRPVILHRKTANNYVEGESLQSWRKYFDTMDDGYQENNYIFQEKMFSGDYTGYWGAPSRVAAIEASKNLGFDIIINPNQ